MIDLRSDTLSKPDEAMLRSVHDVTLADEKRDGDPTVKELEVATAELLGMDDSVYLPSGTMANQLAAQIQTTPGQEVILDRWTHAYTSEFAGLARWSQLQVRTFDGAPDGCPSPDLVRETVDQRSQWPGAKLLVLENTHNKRGGVAVPADRIDEAARAATESGLRVHLDGARLGNAAVALDEPLSAFTDGADSVMFDLSKGLGAPIGALLAGDEEFIATARQYRNAAGGGWRQAGVIAGMGLLALENVGRLATDHANAARFAERLGERTDLEVQPPDSNLVFANTDPLGTTGPAFASQCAENGVRVGHMRDNLLRFCFYRDITRSDVDDAVDRISEMVVS